MTRVTSSGTVVFNCFCGVRQEGAPEDARIAGDILHASETEEKYRRLIKNAPFDRVNQQVMKDCPKCGLDYMTQIRVGAREVVVCVCSCGYDSSRADSADPCTIGVALLVDSFAASETAAPPDFRRNCLGAIRRYRHNVPRRAFQVFFTIGLHAVPLCLVHRNQSLPFGFRICRVRLKGRPLIGVEALHMCPLGHLRGGLSLGRPCGPLIRTMHQFFAGRVVENWPLGGRLCSTGPARHGREHRLADHRPL